MKPEVHIEILPANQVPDQKLTYVVIGAQLHDKWFFVRHRDRITWELPAGHIEPGEEPMEAAQRELFEETGINNAELQVLHDYSVTISGKTKYGRLYHGVVKGKADKPESEISEVRLESISPKPYTYPEAHRAFLGVLGRAGGQ